VKPFNTVTGRMAPLDRADVDTDQIIPKQFLKIIERTGFGQYLFYDWRKSGDFVLDKPEHRGARILVAGPNFGCGSSREHAPWALQQAGFDVIVAPSFADIFRNNCGNVGMLAVTLPEGEVRRLMVLATDKPATEAVVDLHTEAISAGPIQLRFAVDPFLKERLLNGWDEIDMTIRKLAKIEHFESSRPAWMPVVH
jgi:3-isopropylmalate/(R)-2-methylmalate dehydratase small subunit